MAKKKQVVNDSPEQDNIRQRMEFIANSSTRGEKISFDRSMDNMVSLMALLVPIENQLLDLMVQKQPIIDQIEELRATMVKKCVHPVQNLTVKDNIVHCKFCNRRFNPL